MQIGRRFGVGGRTWTLITSSSNGLSTTLAVAGVITLYVIRNALDRERLGLPDIPIWTADWLAIGQADVSLAVESTIISVADPSVAFSVVADPATDLGFLLAPLKTAGNPFRPAPLRRLRQGLQLGIRQGM